MGKTTVVALALLLSFGCIGQQAQGSESPDVAQHGQVPPPGVIQGGQLNINTTPQSGLEKGLIEVPDPLSGDNPVYHLVPMSVPQPGESARDPAFNTTITRATATPGIRHEYSRFDPFNRGKTRVVLQEPATGEWRVYRTPSVPYDVSQNLMTTLNLEDPRWDPVLPNTIWGLRDFSIITVDVATGSESVVKDFSKDKIISRILASEPDIYQITMNNEGESSLDKRYWAFILKGTGGDYRARYVFTWDYNNDKVLGVYKIAPGESSIDWVGMSALGSYVLIGGDDSDRGNITGFMMADKELKRFHKLDFATAHSDVGLDQAGNEVIVMQDTRTDYIDMIPINWTTKSIDESGGSYAGTGRVPLVRLYYDSASPHGLNSGVHVSCNAPGYCIVSTYAAPGAPEQNWLDRSMILVKLDGARPRAFYLAKVYGTRGDYWEETHATITTDGKRVMWATNWNQSVGLENAKSVFDMQLDLG